MPDDDCSSEVYLLDQDKKEYLQKEQWKCSAGIGKCTIDYNGDVYCCPFIRNYCLGNLVNESMDAVWSNKKRFEFLKLIAKENNNSRANWKKLYTGDLKSSIKDEGSLFKEITMTCDLLKQLIDVAKEGQRISKNKEDSIYYSNLENNLRETLHLIQREPVDAQY